MEVKGATVLKNVLSQGMADIKKTWRLDVKVATILVRHQDEGPAFEFVPSVSLGNFQRINQNKISRNNDYIQSGGNSLSP